MLFARSKECTTLFIKWMRTAAAVLFFINIIAYTHAFAASVTVQLNAYDADGTNTYTGRLGSGVSIIPTVRGAINTTVTWSLSGAGSLSTSGLYTAPGTMPSNSRITVKATSNADTAVSATYTFNLLNPAPGIRYATGWPLPTDTTTTLTVVGSNFEPTTVIYVNGHAEPTTYQSSTTLLAKVWIPYNQYGPVQVVAQTAAPGGGNTSAISVPVKPLVINLTAFDENGTNTGTARLGSPVLFRPLVTGSSDPNLVWTINWSVQGAGSISSSGYYQPPATMPANPVVTVIATLAANSQINSKFQLTLSNPSPVVNAISPTHLQAGTTGVITVEGRGFVPGSQILVNSSALTTTFKSSNALTASIPSGQSNPALISVQNPSPGGSRSPSYSLQIDNPSSASATIGTTPGLNVQSNFIGLSHGWNGAQWDMGTAQNGINYIYRALIQQLMNPTGSRPFLIRIGGGDTSYWPASDTVTAFAQLAARLPVHFTLGVNLATDNPGMAQDQAWSYLSAMPAGSVDAIEIGNEPDNYIAFGIRPNPYTIGAYTSQFSTWENSILSAGPSSTKFMGPSWGSMLTLHQDMSAFEAAEASRVSIFSQHAYGEFEGLQNYPENYLLSNAAATTGPGGVANYIATAHQRGQVFRIGEINSIDDGGIAGISNSFQSALWAIDTMFEYAKVGVDGVNWHGTSGSAYSLFNFATSRDAAGKVLYSLQNVNPIYYGLLLFHRATENTSRLLPVTLNTQANIKVWATIDQNSTAHVVIINKDESFAGNISISIPGYGTAQMVSLVAPSYESEDDVSIGGQTFDGSVDGNLVGSQQSQSVTPSNGTYSIPLQPTSAVMLTLTK